MATKTLVFPVISGPDALELSHSLFYPYGPNTQRQEVFFRLKITDKEYRASARVFSIDNQVNQALIDTRVRVTGTVTTESLSPLIVGCPFTAIFSPRHKSCPHPQTMTIIVEE